MIRLNRTTEYGLMALRHMSRKHLTRPLEVTSAREIADSYGLPFEITAKTLQKLRDTGLIQSAQGARGGYLLLRPLTDVSLAEFLAMMEGPQSMVVCATPSTDEDHHTTPITCEYGKKCEIKHVMNRLNTRFVQFLSDIRLAELANDFPSPPVHDYNNKEPVAALKLDGFEELNS